MKRKWNYIIIGAYALMLTINALANILPINNMTTGEISDAYFNLFTPAGITFSIWGVIYTLLFIYVISTFNFMDKKIAIAFIVSSIFNGAWIICWHYQWLLMSLIIMILLLITLTYINEVIHKTNTTITVKIPFQIYWGWISVATIANVTVYLVHLNWQGFNISPEIWTQIVIAIGTLLGIAVLHFRKAYAFAFVIIWAYIGILIRHINQLNNAYIFIILTTTVMLVLLTLFMIFTGLNSRRKNHVE